MIFCHLYCRPRPLSKCYFASLCTAALVHISVPSDIYFCSFLSLDFLQDAFIFGIVGANMKVLGSQSLRMLSQRYQGSLRARKLRHPQRVTHIQGLVDSWGKCKWWPSKLAVSFDLPEHHFWDIHFSYHFNISWTYLHISIHQKYIFYSYFTRYFLPIISRAFYKHNIVKCTCKVVKIY